MNIVIIQYNAGNIQSVLFALERIGVSAVVSNNAEVISKADKIIFPGVGEASSAMEYLKSNHLDTLIKNLQQPILGICLGMQLLCKHSEEGDTNCLGIFEETVQKFNSSDITYKVPQIGWNTIYELNSQLFNNIPENSYCYFVHSYYAHKGSNTIATANYIHPYSAALQKNNFYGVQFHPEKSADTGEIILQNFLNL